MFDMFVCISFMCLRVQVDLIQPLAARSNKRCSLSVCLSVCLYTSRIISNIKLWPDAASVRFGPSVGVH